MLFFNGFINSSTMTSAYFCPHSVFNSGYLVEFVCLKSDLIDILRSRLFELVR